MLSRVPCHRATLAVINASVLDKHRKQLKRCQHDVRLKLLCSKSSRIACLCTLDELNDEWNEEELLESLFNLLTLYSIYPLNTQSHCNVLSVLLFNLIITPSLASALDEHRKQLKRCRRSARLKLCVLSTSRSQSTAAIKGAEKNTVAHFKLDYRSARLSWTLKRHVVSVMKIFSKDWRRCFMKMSAIKIH